MDKKEIESDGVEKDDNTVPAQIQAFAAKLGEEVGQAFQCYVYRVVHDESTGRLKKPLVKKYTGVEPDPIEIAEKFREGTYYLQFIWKIKKQQFSKSYTLDVDKDAFPAFPKNANGIVPYGVPGSPGMSDSMTLQLATLHEITEVMKTAYSSGNAGSGPGRSGVQQDPLDMFSGLMETMESSFARAMTIQSTIMERVFTRNMERNYGLIEDATIGSAAAGPEAESGIIGKYAPLVREVVDGLKTVVGFFGDSVPAEVVKKVTGNDRFKTLLKDQKALVVIGQALRKEFGDGKAAALMNTFGVRMVLKQGKAEPVAQTPPIAALGRQQGQGNGFRAGQAVPAAKVIKTKINGDNGKTKMEKKKAA